MIIKMVVHSTYTEIWLKTKGKTLIKLGVQPQLNMDFKSIFQLQSLEDNHQHFLILGQETFKIHLKVYSLLCMKVKLPITEEKDLVMMTTKMKKSMQKLHPIKIMLKDMGQVHLFKTHFKKQHTKKMDLIATREDSDKNLGTFFFNSFHKKFLSFNFIKAQSN